MWKNMKISWKILSGYAVSFLLMLLVGGIAIWRLNEINTTVTDLSENLVIDERLAHDITAQITASRLFANRYIFSPNQADLDKYNNELALLNQSLAQADKEITKGDRVKLLEAMHTDVDTYIATFNEIQTLIEDRSKVQAEVMDVEAPLAQEKFDALSESLDQDANVKALFHTDQARVAFERMRLNAFKYLVAGDTQWSDRFETRYLEFEAAINELETLEITLQQRQLANDANDIVITYAEAFRSVQSDYARQMDLFNNTLSVIGPRVAATSADMVESVAADLNTRSEETRNTVNQTFIVIVVAIAVAIGLGLLIGSIVSRGISNGLNQAARIAQQIATVDVQTMTQGMERLAEGDLTVKIEVTAASIPVDSNDEVGMMARSFNAIIENLHMMGESFRNTVEKLNGVLTEISENSNMLSAASTQLSVSADQAGQVTGQIATTIQQIAQGTTQQSESVARTASNVEQMGRAIEGVAKGAQQQAGSVARASDLTNQIMGIVQQVAGVTEEVKQDSTKAADRARSGSVTVQETINGMESIQAKVNLLGVKVTEMGKRSKQIDAIVQTIEEIASQTNLLALNAAIEAARAGEHGKGFAIVAEEVRKLAERASAATREIGGLINGIQDTIAEAVTAMDAGTQEVVNGVSQANQAGKSLDEILNAAEEVLHRAERVADATRSMNTASNELVAAMDNVSAVVEENTASTEEMAAGSNEVVQAIENIASISEENGAAAEEVSASAEEMSAQVEEVAASAQSLAEMAQTLMQLVGQFKLSNEQAADGHQPVRIKAAERRQPVPTIQPVTPSRVQPAPRRASVPTSHQTPSYISHEPVPSNGNGHKKFNGNGH